MFFLLWILYAIKNIWKRFFRFKKPGNFQKIMFLNPKFGIIFSFIVNYLKIVFVLHSSTLGYKKVILIKTWKKSTKIMIFINFTKKSFSEIYFFGQHGDLFSWFFCINVEAWVITQHILKPWLWQIIFGYWKNYHFNTKI